MTSPRNVLLLNTALDIGGAERVIASLARGLRERGLCVVLCTLKGKGSIGRGLQDDGFEVISLGSGNGSVARYSAFWRLAAVIRARGVQIVHSHGSASLWEAALAKRLSRGIKLVHTFHYGNYPFLRWQNRVFERLGSLAADKLVAVGYRQRSAIAKTYRRPEADIDVILNGVDKSNIDEELHERIRIGSRANVVIGSVSSLIEQKGLDVLLGAARILKDRDIQFRLVVVGEGPLRRVLETQVRCEGLTEEVEFLGWVDEASSRVLPAIDIFVQPSRWEAMSIVVLEAMAAGLPIVATDVGDNSSVLEDGTSGFIVPPGQRGDLADRLELLIRDKGRRRQMGTRAMIRQSEMYSEAIMLDNYMRAYQSALVSI